MRHRTATLIVGSVLLIGAVAFQARRLWHRCGDEDVIAMLAKLVPRDADGDGVIISNAHLLAGQLFAFPYRCEADMTPIRGNVDLSKKGWQHVWYMVSTIDGMRHASLFQP